MSYLLENKESQTILKYLKNAFECNRFPQEIVCDNGREFRNVNIQKYLNEKNIKLYIVCLIIHILKAFLKDFIKQ